MLLVLVRSCSEHASDAGGPREGMETPRYRDPQSRHYLIGQRQHEITPLP